MDKKYEKLREMYDLQMTLNNKTCGENWFKTKVSKSTKKRINWKMCILDECSELLNSTDWRHWKSMKEDYDNAKLELIDILHFQMSLDIENNYGSIQVAMMHNKTLDINNDHGVVTDDWTVLLENYIYAVFSEDNDSIIHLFPLFNFFGLNIDEVYDIYMMKNWLNEFRLNNGYADGSYNKVILDMEDNDRLLSFVKSSGLKEAKVQFETFYKQNS
jgi:dimeric dUTPase (all-alpha-NTP-PPase superfamily)